MSKTIKIPGRIESVATGKVVTGANFILDDTKGKKQNVINEETDAELLRLDQEKQGNLTFDQTPTEDSTNPVTSGGVYAADQMLSQAIEAILLLIPSAASELNKLVDLATMNSSISTATASFKGTYNLVSDLHLTVSATHAQIAAALDALSLGADNNDYAFVQVPNTDTAPTDIAKTERYKFNGENWAYEYDLNNSGFTTAQWNAINSGITTLLVAKLSALPTNEALTLALAGKQDNLTFDNAPTAGSNNPVKSGGIYTRNNEIVALINALDAAKQNVLTFDTTPTNGSTNPVTSNGVYLAIQLVQTAVVALDGRMGTAETKISTAEGNIVNLQAAYAALTQSDIVVVSGALPSSGQQQNIIYRQPDQDHTPPQFYSDYMWNGTAWVLMATYNNAIDPRPKKGSQNLVTSGGIFDNIGALDVSELNATENPHTLKPYATLDAALADIPSDYQKGGMSIKYVQSSDNRYVQYRLKALTFTTDVEEWQEIISEDYTKAKASTDNSDLDLTDNGNNVLARFYDGHLRTKNFDSKTASEQIDEQENSITEISDKMENVPETTSGDEDLEISDENNNILAQFRNGGVRTKNFNSENVLQRQDLLMEPIMLFAYGEGNDATPDDNTHFYGWKNGKCAWQRAIDSADGITPTIIYCKGHIKVTQANQFTQQEDGFYNVVFIPSTKSNIQLVGEGADRTSLEVRMPDDFGSSNIENHQPMGIYGNNSVVSSLSVVGKNCRYCIHVDATARNIGDADNHNIYFKDIELRHYNNASEAYELAFACCANDGMIITAERCRFIQDNNNMSALYTHDNKYYNKSGKIKFINCIFECNKDLNTDVGSLHTLGSNTDCMIELDNVDFSGRLPVIVCETNNTSSKTNADDYDANLYIGIKGTMNVPIGYRTRVQNSAVLRITSKTAGANSSVRFDETSSAFDLLIKGVYNTDYTADTGVVHVDGYQYRDGVDVLHGYAMGELALDKGTVASIQKRLGDCSSSNKSLVVTVDGTDYTITFNQDYTNYTDEQMLAVFTSVIGSVADVELYNWGADYYPELQPIMSRRKNSSQVAILCGMGVFIDGGTIRKATTDEEVSAVALEDIAPSCFGRIATKAVLNIFESDRHHVCLETYPQTDNDKYTEAYQGYFGIGDTPGVFRKKQSGVGPLHKDWWGYLTINK